MKTKIGILTLLISLSIFWFGCSNRPISHQTEDLPITTPSMNFGTEEIAGEHRQSESNQRSLTPTITQTDTYTIFTSSALTHTLTGDVPISSETTIAMENLGRDIYLFDVKENMERKLFQDHFKATLIKWYKSGCRLVVGADYGDIVLVDFGGKNLQKLFNYEGLKVGGEYPYGNTVFLSPNNQWVWFWEASGRPYNEMGPTSRAEFQDIKAVSIDLLQGPFRISSNHGGWVADWSPDSNMIAFSDYDDQAILQVFSSTTRGENKKQITSFDQPSSFKLQGTDIHKIEWSPNGKLISINYSKVNDERRRYIGMIINVKRNERMLHLPDARVLWWIDNDKVAAWLSKSDGQGIYVLNVYNGNVMGKVLTIEYPQMLQIHPFTTSDLIGFFSLGKTSQSYRFYIYDYKSGKVDYIPAIKKIVDLTNWIATPTDFPGKDSCKK